MRIGAVEIDSPVVGAPLADASASPYRRIIRRLGAGLVYTEMMKAKSLLQESRKTRLMAKFEEDERPIAMQICGRNPSEMAEAARILAELGADIIDINFGCPVRKVTRLGEGAALMREPELCEKIVRAVAGAVSIPVTAKMRSGWDESSITAPEIAKRAEDAGAAAVCIHARTKTKMYSGGPDFKLIREIRDSLKIPVIGNGGVRAASDAKRMSDETGCDAVMIGRAALGYPWIFREAKAFIMEGKVPPTPTFGELRDLLLEHYAAMCEFYNEGMAILKMRKFITWYSRGVPGSRRLRHAIFMINSRGSVERALRGHFEPIENEPFLRTAAGDTNEQAAE